MRKIGSDGTDGTVTTRITFFKVKMSKLLVFSPLFHRQDVKMFSQKKIFFFGTIHYTHSTYK